ncbi:unnamed protein product, partial [Ilex paraguariensis]
LAFLNTNSNSVAINLILPKEESDDNGDGVASSMFPVSPWRSCNNDNDSQIGANPELKKVLRCNKSGEEGCFSTSKPIDPDDLVRSQTGAIYITQRLLRLEMKVTK